MLRTANIVASVVYLFVGSRKVDRIISDLFFFLNGSFFLFDEKVGFFYERIDRSSKKQKKKVLQEADFFVGSRGFCGFALTIIGKLP